MQKKCLIIDDSASDRYLNKIHLSKLNFNCTEAESGCEAIELLRKEKFDLILLDMIMPIMNGLELAIFIRRLTSAPVIMVTCTDDLISVDTLKQYKLNYIIKKPIYTGAFKIILDELFK